MNRLRTIFPKTRTPLFLCLFISILLCGCQSQGEGSPSRATGGSGAQTAAADTQTAAETPAQAESEALTQAESEALTQAENEALTQAAAAPGEIMIAPMQLSADQHSLLNLIHSDFITGLFEYTAGSPVQEVHFFTEILEDGILSPAGGAGFLLSSRSGTDGGQDGAHDGQSGQIAILAGSGEESGVRFSWQNAAGNRSQSSWYHPEKLQPELSSRAFASSGTVLEHQIQIPVNQKTVLAAIAECDSGEAGPVSLPLSGPLDLAALQEQDFCRVILFSAAFTDFPVTEGLISWNGIVRDRSALSAETLEWLEHYNALPVSEQLMISAAPAEFLTVQAETEDAAASEEEP